MTYDIVNEEDYRDALRRFIDICETPNEEDINELFLLITLMEKYERQNCSFS